MQWIKHMTDMADDPRVRRLVRKYGALGYAVYNIAIERIGKRLSSEHVIPDLEETAEDLADLLRADTVRVEEIMTEAMNLGLFEQDEMTGRILCAKIYKFLEQSQTSSKRLRKMITDYRVAKTTEDHGTTMTDHGTTSDSMIKSEENRTRTRTRTRTGGEEAAPEDEPGSNTISPRDTVKAAFVEAIGQLLPTTAWPDIPKQMVAITDMAQMTRDTQPSTPIETPEQFAQLVVSTYCAMKRKGKHDYWKTAGFEPKAIKLRFGDVVSEIARSHDKHQEAHSGTDPF